MRKYQIVDNLPDDMHVGGFNFRLIVRQPNLMNKFAASVRRITAASG